MFVIQSSINTVATLSVVASLNEFYYSYIKSLFCVYTISTLMSIASRCLNNYIFFFIIFFLLLFFFFYLFIFFSVYVFPPAAARNSTTQATISSPTSSSGMMLTRMGLWAPPRWRVSSRLAPWSPGDPKSHLPCKLTRLWVIPRVSF